MSMFVAMAGLHGYLPNYAQEHDSHESAVDDLAMLHELTQEQIEELRKDSILELNLEIHGNAYCEIVEQLE